MFLLVVVTLFVLVPLGRKGLALVRTVPARYGRVTVAVEGEALVVREEWVLFADVTGKVVPVAQEGERIPRGALVARLVPPGTDQSAVRKLDEALAETKRRAILDEQSPLAAKDGPGGTATGASGRAIAATRQSLEAERGGLTGREPGGEHLVRAGSAGTVSYAVDGLEGILGPESLPDLLAAAEPAAQIARGGEARVVQPGSTVAVGRPVAKVVDNFQVWFVADFPKGGPRLPRVGERLRLRLVGTGGPAGATCTAAVVDRRARPDGVRLALAPVEYWPEFGRVRRATLELRLGDFEGVYVPRSALQKRGGTAGVAVETWRGRQFQAVTVRGGDRERVVVDGLAPGTRVWKNPGGQV